MDPGGPDSRLRPCIQHRVYSVPCPNYLWHVDGNHKLIRWRIVVHGSIDGFSRLVTFLKASDNNLASTVLELFDDATSTYGIPLRVRTDHGGENVKMWERMYEHRGAERRPVIVGSSVHNERIERFNRDINKSCERQYKPIFYDLESKNLLDPENDTDIFCLHYVFMPRINRTIEEFRQAHNHHSISTEGNKSPLQLFYSKQHLIARYQGQSSDDPYNGCSPDILLQRNLPHVAVPITNCPLNEEQLNNLTSAIDPLNGNGVSTYQDVVSFVGRCLTT